MEIFKQIKNKNPSILVFGDIMLDKFIYGKVERISPEAPVPVVECHKEVNALGGCGNVIRNLSNLGASVSLISYVGNDLYGEIIKNNLIELDVDIDGLLFFNNSKTTNKMRIIAEKQQVVRVDWDSDGLSNKQLEKIDKLIIEKIKSIDGIIISDYDKGLCTNYLTSQIIDKAVDAKIPIFVDPKGNDWSKYSRATFITPNTKEAEQIIGYKLNKNQEFEGAGKSILDNYKIDNCLITRGKDGMAFISSKEIFYLNSDVQEVFDVSGAGDTVIACLASSFVSGLDLRSSIEFSNKAAGIAVGHLGTYAITERDLE